MEFVETIPREFNRVKVYTFDLGHSVPGSGVGAPAEYKSLTLDEDAIIVAVDATYRTAEASDGEVQGIFRAVISHIPDLTDESTKEPVWANLAVEYRSPFARVEFKERFGAYIKMKAEETIHAYLAALLRNTSASDIAWKGLVHIYARVKG